MTSWIHGLVRFLKRYRKMAAEHMFTDALQCLAPSTARCRFSFFTCDVLRNEVRLPLHNRWPLVMTSFARPGWELTNTNQDVQLVH